MEGRGAMETMGGEEREIGYSAVGEEKQPVVIVTGRYDSSGYRFWQAEKVTWRSESVVKEHALSLTGVTVCLCNSF